VVREAKLTLNTAVDDGFAVELQKNFAVVSVLREQSGLTDVRKIIFFFVLVVFEGRI